VSIILKVVITSYGICVSEFQALAKRSSKIGKGAAASGHNGTVFGIEWRRIVLDEAHTIKNASTGGARAVGFIRARRRWFVFLELS
jgi:DNA repair protein RAD5